MTGIDLIFSEINSRLNISWLEEKYIRGWNVTEQGVDKVITYKDGGDYETFVLRDDIHGCSIFIPVGEETYVSEPVLGVNGSIERERDVDFVVFANLRAINGSDYVYTEQLKEEIEAYLLREENVSIESYTDIPEDIVGSLRVGRDVIIYPFVCLRWRLKVHYGFSC